MTTSTETLDKDLAELFTNVFGSWRQTRGAATAEPAIDRELWATLAELGLTRLTDPEGSGAGWVESAGLLRAAARVAAPVPLVENDLLSGWLRDRAGQPDDGRMRTVAVLDADGRADRVPWASQTDAITLLYPSGNDWRLAEIDAADADITPGFDLAGQGRDDIRVDLAALSSAPVDAALVREYRLRGALARAIQSTGAMAQIVELSVAYAMERRQFGRAIAKFQAVQQLIAAAAGESLLASSAVDAAVAAASGPAMDLDQLELRVAIARSMVGHAASVVVRNGHQVHGAIGTTFEHSLHEFTKPVLAWRTEFGSVREWDSRLTELLLTTPGTAWELGLPVGR